MSQLKSMLRALSHKSSLFSRIYSHASELKNKWYATWSDEDYLKMLFKKKTGRELNLENPVGFCEKIQWLKLHNRKPQYTMMVDKVLAKEFVAGVIGSEYVIPTLNVWNNADEIDFNALPNEFVLKCNHNSGGGMCICTDKANLDIKWVRYDLARGLESDSYLPSREWPYKNVARKILAEKYMSEDGREQLVDYKFYCFNGTPKFLYVALANYRNGQKNAEVSFRLFDWALAPFYIRGHNPFPYAIEKPEKFDEMIQIAGELSKGIPFVRVDLYYIDGKIYFSEFTFSPGGGLNEFEPYEWEKEIGSWLDLSLV